jgi:hypothetical protein
MNFDLHHRQVLREFCTPIKIVTFTSIFDLLFDLLLLLLYFYLFGFKREYGLVGITLAAFNFCLNYIRRSISTCAFK